MSEEMVEVYVCTKCFRSIFNDKKINGYEYMPCVFCGKNDTMKYVEAMPKSQYFREWVKPELLRKKKYLEEELTKINKSLKEIV